jgi:hypothetical protein
MLSSSLLSNESILSAGVRTATSNSMGTPISDWGVVGFGIGLVLLMVGLQYLIHRPGRRVACSHCGVERESWMVKCAFRTCTKYYCFWSCSWSTMETCNANWDPESGRISMCLSHLRKGHAQIATLGGAVYSRDCFSPMPRPIKNKQPMSNSGDAIAQRTRSHTRSLSYLSKK